MQERGNVLIILVVVVAVSVVLLSSFAGYKYMTGNASQAGTQAEIKTTVTGQTSPKQTPQPTIRAQTSPSSVKIATPTAAITPAKTEILSSRYKTKVFSFTIPEGYEVQERDPGFYSVIPKGGYSGGLEGVHIDTRTEMPISIQSKLSEAKAAFKDLEIKDLNGWKIIRGTQRTEEGSLEEGMSFKDAYLDTGTQVLAISSADKNSFSLFEPLIQSITTP